ncbi:DUF6443 domain-containing protein [Pontibacter fetidus]|uniref:DUF6443 domain-containing protein n=1 Tax=Pontibacter fetidus TaxID=2700082 RepID=UPI0013912438|nr:DUF6443 domain-containing protein [Pontibacter fetidus]
MQKIYFTPISLSLLKVKRFLLLPLVLVVNLAVAQHIDGPTFCTVGQTYTYDFVDTYLPDSYSWQVTGGTKTYTSKSYANIQWTTPGINVIKYINSDGEFELTVDVVSPGGYAETPVDAGVITPCKSFTHTANMIPANYYSDDYGDTGDDIFYKFTLYEQQEVEISHCGSALSGTFLYLLNNSFQEIEFNDGTGPICSGKASIRKTLAAGVYYVVTEGAYGENGSITTQISVPARAGSTKENAINAGTISLGGVPYSNTQSNISSNYFCQNYGQPSDDIYYKFTLSEANDIQISHCASSIATYLHLLDSNGNLLQSNGGNGPVCTTSRASLSTYLQPGTYYVVSEGSGSNAGSITTQIQAIAQPPTVSIVSNAVGDIVCKNSSVTFTATATNAGASPSYQWKLNGNNVGENSATLTSLGPFNTDDEVSVVVTSSLPGNLTASSNIIFLDAYEAKAGTLSSSGGTIFCAGENVSTTILVSGYDGTPHFWVSNNGGVTWNIYNDITPGSSFTLNLTTPGKWIIRTQAYNTMCGWSEVKELALDVLTKPALTITAEQGKGVTLSTILKVTDQNQVPLSCSWTRSPDLNLDEEFEASHGANTTVIVNPVVPTTYTATFWNGACYSQASITVSPNNYNYIVSNIILEEGKKTVESLEQLGADKREQNVTYLDGLGREVQTIITQGSPLGKDLVQPFAYDVYGRKEKSYLPYAANDGNGFFKSNAIVKDNSYIKSDQYTFYQATKAIAGKHSQDEAPFAQTIFNASPLNHVVKQGAPGIAWQPIETVTSQSIDHSIKTLYRTNLAGEVRVWDFDFNSKNIESKGFYAPNTLYVTETRDEADAVAIEYKDFDERLVLKKVQVSGEGTNTTGESDFLLTYYVYDDFDNLRLVIQPEGYRNHLPPLNGEGNITINITSSFVANWCFSYLYDARKRLIEKHVPGNGWMHFIYDNYDRLAFTQDARQRQQHEWGYTIYDAINRPVETGIYRPTLQLDRQGLQAELDNWFQNTNGAPYVMQAAQKEPLVYTYYDHYDHAAFAGKSFTSEIGVTNDPSKAKTYNNVNLSVKGQVTGQKVKVLNTPIWLTKVNFYNDKYQPIQTIEDNNLAGIDRITTRLDFAGKVQETLLSQIKGSSYGSEHFAVQKEFIYDDGGRLLETKQRISTDYNTIMSQSQVILARNEYNELGQLVDKNVHSMDGGATFLQSIDRRYNIRGWLTHINNSNIKNDQSTLNTNDDDNDVFGLELKYNSDLKLDSFYPNRNQFNGNISEALWRSSTDNTLRGYSYNYDKLNRLLDANYRADLDYTNSWTEEVERFTTGNLSYDGNSNIKTLTRRGLISEINGNKTYGLLDNLSYHYGEINGTTNTSVSNHLVAVDDKNLNNIQIMTGTLHDFEDKNSQLFNGSASDYEYSYDANGNLTKDDNKGITEILYNHLNLPHKVKFGSSNWIEFYYSATGTKLKKTVYLNNVLQNTTDYVGSMVYENQKLQFIQIPDGRILYQPAVPERPWTYQYTINDHLGNSRMIVGEPKTEVALASMESEYLDENGLFTGLDATRAIVNPSFDHTHLTNKATGDNTEVVRLNAGEKIKPAPGRSFHVMPGDKVSAKVYVKYLDLRSNQDAVNVSTLITAIAGGSGFSIIPEAGGSVITTTNGTLVGSLGSASASSGESAPLAFLKYYYYDDYHNLITSGAKRVSGNAAVWDANSLNSPHEELSLTLPPISEAGYVKIELTHERIENVDVYFDDLTISHEHIVVQENHYDPWGLNLTGIEKLGSPDSKFQFNGKEKQTDLGINWIDYGARMYDSQIGRWHVSDPLSEKYGSTSPYVYTLNNPVNAIDPDGRLVIYVNGYYNELFGHEMFGEKGIGPTKPKLDYWRYFDPGFVTAVNEFFGNDQNNFFADGSSLIGGDLSGADRYNIGYTYAHRNYKNIIKDMKAGEKVKFVSHSEGSAFAAGMAAYFIMRRLTDKKAPEVSWVLHFSPDEADEFETPEEPLTVRIHDLFDWVSPIFYDLKGVDYSMTYKNFKSLDLGDRLGSAHGRTPTRAALKAFVDLLGQFINSPDVKRVEGEGGVLYYRD